MITRDIVIVGAGPVGLAAALAVVATGRSATIVEAGDPQRVRPGSRAIFIHQATLQVLERIQAGLGYELSRQGLTWTTKRTLYRGRTIYLRTYRPPAPGGLPTITSLPQVVTERVLADACTRAGVEFIWNAPVERVSGDSHGVRVLMETGAEVSARYVIGADGARSAVRESSGLRLEGPRTTNAFVIVDAAEDDHDPLPLERVFHYEHPAVDRRNVLFVPFAGHWRIDLQCRPDDDPDAFSGPEGVRRWLPKVMPAKYADRVTWVSTYVFRQAVANSFIDATGRVLLVGEAAHVFAPFGARGLNSGIADAYVAAAAIDAARKADSADARELALAGFAASRRSAAARNRAASSAALRHLLAASPASRAIRWTAGHLAPSVTPIARWMDKAPYGPPLGEADTYGMRY